MTRNITKITKDLDRISGLSGSAAWEIEDKAEEIHELVEDILKWRNENPKQRGSIFETEAYDFADRKRESVNES